MARPIRVTTLAADGPGSLREALLASGPRLIVFEAGGVIDLGGHSLIIRNPHVTVAGQTAPDPGITIIRGSLVVETSDVMIQHLAVRPGDRGPAPWAPDGIGAHRGNAPVHDVVFDHCSATWAVDENLSASGPADVDPVADPDATSHDVVIRHCLIAEGLSHATHPKGEHSKGTLIHDGVRNVTIVGCLFAHNRERNPRLKGSTTAIVANNVIYNWGSACIGVGARGNRKMLRPAEVVVTGNVAIAGADTRSRFLIKNVDPGARVFARDNAGVTRIEDGVVPLDALPSWAASIPRISMSEVLRTVGSRPARRDPIDARIVQSVIDGTGRIIDSQEQVGGYPVRPATTRKLVIPEDPAERQRWLDQLGREVEGTGTPARSLSGYAKLATDAVSHE